MDPQLFCVWMANLHYKKRKSKKGGDRRVFPKRQKLIPPVFKILGNKEIFA